MDYEFKYYDYDCLFTSIIDELIEKGIISGFDGEYYY